MRNFSSLFFLLITAFFMMSCAGKPPSAKSAQSISRSYLNNYAKKYPQSQLGQGRPLQVQINGVHGDSLKTALVDTIVGMSNGHMARVLLTVRNHPPFGWKVESWEILDQR